MGKKSEDKKSFLTFKDSEVFFLHTLSEEFTL